MAYLGNSPVLSQQEYRNIDNISGSFNGVTTSFALLVNGVAPVPAPQSSNQCLISVNGVVQKPDDTGATGFRISGGNIIFSSAPTGGQSFFGVILAGADYIYAGQNFPDGTVSAPSITFNQDLDTGFYRSGAGEVKFTANGANAVTLSSNNLTAPSFIPTSSSAPTNGVYLPAANSVAISTNSAGRIHIGSTGTVNIVGAGTAGSTQAVSFNGSAPVNSMVLDSSGRLGIGTSTFSVGTSNELSVNGSSSSSVSLKRGDALAGYVGCTSSQMVVNSVSNLPLLFYTNDTERARIDTSGRLLVGTSSARSNVYISSTAYTPIQQIESSGSTYSNGLSLLQYSSAGYAPILTLGVSASNTAGTNALIANGSDMGIISFVGNDGTNFREAARIQAGVDGAPGAGDMPGRLVFSTTADGASSPTERMRINQNGLVAIKTTAKLDPNGVSLAVAGIFPNTPIEVQQDSVSTHYAITFRNGNGLVGAISTSGSTTTYNSLSDYRLKRNVKLITDGIIRFKQLKPSRFNFIADSDQTIDGFIAHEVQKVVPEAITGEKDAVDDDGNPVYQGIDQSKLVPLLTAALQEAIAKIESLEARLTAAGI